MIEQTGERKREGLKKKLDEILETMWMIEEEGKKARNELIERTPVTNPEKSIKIAEEQGLIKIANDEISFTEKGRKRAREIIRRHRLAEFLLSEVFEMKNAQVEPQACEFEHILSSEVAESVCTFLGHPPICPHGKPIPPGECCRRFTRDIKPLVVSLKDFEVGSKGRIVFMRPRDHETIDRLSGFGVIPGSIIKLHQKKPTFVIKIGETDLALDVDIARDIYVKRVDK